jgi:hypothetical protein|tara:strand:- start:1769 stop:2425 length:657 start_codon:yes stop_codon:yes gene_type:complete
MAHSRKNFTNTTLSNIDKYSRSNGQTKLFDQDMFTSAQQKFRFYMLINDLPAAYITQVNRPSYTVETQEHILLDHVVRYPIKVKWEPISFTIREIFNRDGGSVAGNILNKLLARSYYYPDNVNSSDGVQDLLSVNDPALAASDSIYGTKNLSKENLSKALGSVKIISLDPNGNTFESWEIFNGMITSVKFSDLSYSDDGLTDINITIQYDWAKLTLRQ